MEVAFHSGLARPRTSHKASSPPSAPPSAANPPRMQSTGGPPPLMSHQSFQSQHSAFSSYPGSARDTLSTQATNNTSTTTLFGPPSTVSLASTATLLNSGAPIEASNNVLNKRAGADASLFQRSLALQMRLRTIPGFDGWMREEEDMASADDDPVSLLWRTFRRGYPLMELYNARSPAVPLAVDESKIGEAKRAKTAAYKFIQACVGELRIPSEECFILGDLYGDDTTGFVKVRLPHLPLVLVKGCMLTQVR